MSTKTENPYSFVGMQGRVVDWSPYIGCVCRNITGHDDEITKDELAVLVAKKSRECDLARAIQACRNAGESAEVRLLVAQMLGK